jgi:cytochrome c oxidase subunit III
MAGHGESQATGGGHHAPGHPYHMVEPSPWPVVGSVAALVLVTGGLLYMRGVIGGVPLLLLGTLMVIATMIGWWRDVIKESLRGDHTDVVARGLRIGMVLFIASEVLFFFAFFWAFFWGALLAPDLVAISWPPEGLHPVDTWDIPFLNTMILLLSGATVTWAHHAVREGDQATAFKALLLTVILGITFLGFQVYEYLHAIHDLGLTIRTGIYGSTFYMATGFHGFHVFIGATFLAVCTMRAYYATFRADKHVGFEAAAWYWHFVDVVWLFLFICVYWWGGTLAWTHTP